MQATCAKVIIKEIELPESVRSLLVETPDEVPILYINSNKERNNEYERAENF